MPKTAVHPAVQKLNAGHNGRGASSRFLDDSLRRLAGCRGGVSPPAYHTKRSGKIGGTGNPSPTIDQLAIYFLSYKITEFKLMLDRNPLIAQLRDRRL